MSISAKRPRDCVGFGSRRLLLIGVILLSYTALPGYAGAGPAPDSPLPYGDPPTSTWPAVQGEAITVRIEGGGIHQIHSFNLHDNRVRFEANNLRSAQRDFSVRGTEYSSDLELSLSLEQATAQILHDAMPPTHSVDAAVTVVDATDEGTLPAGVLFDGDVAALQTEAEDASRADVVELGGKSAFEGGVTPVQGPASARADAAAGGARTEPEGREVVIEGLATNVWRVSVDGQVQDGTTVEVAPGDTVEWRVAAGPHGVTFRRWSEAEAFLAFDPSVGLEIKDQTRFGPDARGTDETAVAGTLLARAAVREPGTLDALEFICTVHGPGMNGTLQLAAAPVERGMWVEPAPEPSQLAGAFGFHVAAVAVAAPDRGPPAPAGTIVIDANFRGPGVFLWPAGGTQSNDPMITGRRGDVLVFRRALRPANGKRRQHQRTVHERCSSVFLSAEH